jgi:hypothetical protein
MSAGVALEMFRSLSLRHLVVLGTRGQVVGMVTRKDLLPQACDARARAAGRQTAGLCRRDAWARLRLTQMIEERIGAKLGELRL